MNLVDVLRDGQGLPVHIARAGDIPDMTIATGEHPIHATMRTLL